MRVLILLLTVLALGHCAAPDGLFDGAVEQFQIGLLEKEAAAKGSDVAANSKLGKPLQGDANSRLFARFSVKNKATKADVAVAQAVIVLQHKDLPLEFHFVAGRGSDGVYTLDQSLEKSLKGGLEPGKYSVRVLVGDAKLKQPFNWIVADAVLTFTSEATAPKTPKSHAVEYDSRPEIKHTFREPEKGPFPMIAEFFTLACLAPAAILLIGWFSVGFNFGNFPLSIWPLAFHGGMTAIFGLYFVFWLRLNMFDTVKYLAPIAAFTFIAGHRTLRAVAEKRIGSSKKNE